MLADPLCRVSGASEACGPTTGIQSKSGLYDPLATTVAVTFVGEFYQDCDKLAAVEQQ